METPNRTTLIIDGNWLLMSRLGQVKDSFLKCLPKEDLIKAKEDLVDFVAQSINKQINFWGSNIDNIIMVQDGGSWRKELPKPKLYTETYKGNRVTDEELDWSYIWDGLSQLCKSFEANNIMCVTEKTIEGDDWCWYWSRYLNRLGTNTIIWTSDADLKQLVQKDPVTGAWTCWFNERSGLVVHEVFNRSDMDILLNFDAEDPFIDAICRQARKFEYINPDDIVMQKVVCGDSGDNIKSLLRFETRNKKGAPRTLQVSENEWNKVKAELEITDFNTFETKKLIIIGHLLNLKRFSDYHPKVEDICEMFDFNVKLVRLAKEQIPHDTAMLMNKHRNEYVVTDMSFLRNNYKVLSMNTSPVDDLFKDIPNI